MAILRITPLPQDGHGPHSVQSYENFSWSHGRINFRRLEGAYARLASPDTVEDVSCSPKNPAIGCKASARCPNGLDTTRPAAYIGASTRPRKWRNWQTRMIQVHVR